MLAELEHSGLVLLCVAAVCALVLLVSMVLYQRRLAASAGGLPMALKRDDQRWANGVGRYVGDELVWYRTLSLWPAPALRMARSDLEVTLSRAWDPQRDMALRPNLMIAECRYKGAVISLGFPDNGLTGFLSWLEASAPRF